MKNNKIDLHVNRSNHSVHSNGKKYLITRAERRFLSRRKSYHPTIAIHYKSHYIDLKSSFTVALPVIRLIITDYRVVLIFFHNMSY